MTPKCLAAACLLAVAAPSPPEAPSPPVSTWGRPAVIPYPASDPWSAPKAALGERLFSEALLSGDDTVSCATCHQADKGWADGRIRAMGVGHMEMTLRTPTVQDLAWGGRMGWDGKFRDLESVAFAPITSRVNMGSTEVGAIAAIAAAPGYREAFTEAFGSPDVDRGRIERALATYERGIVSPETPFDRWVAGDATAVTPAAERGFRLFDGKAGCSSCHSGWGFTDGSFQDIGSAVGDDVGRGRDVPSSTKLRYAFKVPGLRGVAGRAAYMHDGSVATLRDVIDLYDKGGIDRPSRAATIRPLGLTEVDKDDLVAFVRSLSPVPAIDRR